MGLPTGRHPCRARYGERAEPVGQAGRPTTKSVVRSRARRIERIVQANT